MASIDAMRSRAVDLAPNASGMEHERRSENGGASPTSHCRRQPRERKRRTTGSHSQARNRKLEVVSKFPNPSLKGFRSPPTAITVLFARRSAPYSSVLDTTPQKAGTGLLGTTGTRFPFLGAFFQTFLATRIPVCDVLLSQKACVSRRVRAWKGIGAY